MINEDEEGLKKFIKKYSLNYPNAKVTREVIKKLGGTRGIPTTYIIGRDGKVRVRYFGYRSKDVVEKDIRVLLRL